MPVSKWRELLPFPVDVNDVHSALNESRVARVVRPKSAEGVQRALAEARSKGQRVSVAGGRHAMGGQQFGQDALLLDCRRLQGLTSLDRERGLATLGAGTLWPQVYRELADAQSAADDRWTFRQKQTGGDRLSLGGSVAANIHSRGLTMKPFVDDIETLTVVCCDGSVKRIRRQDGPGLWRLVVGGYGLFGVVTEVELRLTRRHKVRRRVEVRDVDGLVGSVQERIQAGFEYGDFQFAIDPSSDDFLRQGVFACYEPVGGSGPIPTGQAEVPRRAWHHLVYLAHTDKAEAFRLYADFYRRTDGQIYWSDLHQMTPYLDDYHRKLDRRTGAKCRGSEMITELYVPRGRLDAFLANCRSELRRLNANVIYGTIRFIEAEDETLLAWARQPWACVIFNLHVDHDERGRSLATEQFRTLIDLAQQEGGSFYLTYHRWATREQLLCSYPELPQFLAAKAEHDPEGLLDSDWYRWLRRTFGG